jgi:predicted transcriptional regulator
MMICLSVKHRTRTDIIVTTLEAARYGAMKTKIMYTSYLSSQQLRTYLELGITNGLLEYDSKKERYRTTKMGLRLLELYSSFRSMEIAPTLS